MVPHHLITLVGPTASGKTSLGVAIAAALSGEIISADSRQVYRRMDIGTGKDLSEYTLQDGSFIPYHLIDIANPGEVYDLFHWLAAFRTSYQEILQRGKTPLLVGGTGLYVETALRGESLCNAPQNERLRKELYSLSHEALKDILRRYGGTPRTDIGSVRRTIRAIEIAAYYARYPEQDPWKKSNATVKAQGNETQNSPLILCIQLPREERIRRIGERLKKRLEEGLIEEVEQLIASGVPAERLIQYGLEYRFITQHLLGELSREEMATQLEIAIRQFAKRQMTWFRGMERRGYTLYYLDGTQPTDRLCQEALEYIASKQEGKPN